MMDAVRRQAVNLLRTRAVTVSRSFKRVFEADGALGRDGEIVLADLRDFCRARKTTFDRDPYEAARREGRREVFLRISDFLNLDEATVQKLVEVDDGYGG